MKPKDDELTGLIKGFSSTIEGVANSPAFQAIVESQRQADENRIFNEKLKKYEENKFTLTDEEKDKLVFAVGSGNNTYKDICEVLPEMNPATLMQYLQDDPPVEPQVMYYFNHIPRHGIQCFPSLVRFVRVPEGFQELYQFKESDSFYLTVTGENMLYYLKKELIIKQENARREELETQRYENQMALQRKVFFASIIAILIGVIQLLKH